jgi:hypothetical protein
MAREDAVTHSAAMIWLMPVLLGGVITVGALMVQALWSITEKLGDTNRHLAVAIQRVDNLERRTDNLETLFFRTTGQTPP